MVKDTEEFGEYEDKILDVEVVGTTDIKINPDFYIHLDLMNCANALKNPDVQQGFIQYQIIVNHMEVLVRASGRLPDDYEEQIKTFMESKAYIDSKTDMDKKTKLAFKKNEILTSVIFSYKTATDPLKF